MTDDKGTGADINNKGTGAGQGGNDPTKNGTGAGTTFDVSKVGDEDFVKVFDDPRLWKHPRFKSLSERAKKADDIEAQQAEAEKKRLAEQGKFKELAETEKNARLTAEQKYQKAVIDNSIITEASKAGVVDVEAVKALIDRKDIKLNDDGTVAGVGEAVTALLTSKPYLKGTANNNLQIGTGTQPNGQQATGQRFKLSQIKDPVFFKAHEADIMQAQKLGLLIDDSQTK